MGTIQANFFISLDGVVEAPETWHMSYFNDEMGEIVGAGLEVNKGFLMGRKEYDGSSAYWPNETGEFADYFNNIPKYVISSSLQDPTWNNTTVVAGDVESVQAMKDGVDGTLFMSGSAITVPVAAGERPARRAPAVAAPGCCRKGAEALRGRARDARAGAGREQDPVDRRRPPALQVGGLRDYRPETTSASRPMRLVRASRFADSRRSAIR